MYTYALYSQEMRAWEPETVPSKQDYRWWVNGTQRTLSQLLLRLGLRALGSKARGLSQEVTVRVLL